METRRYAQQIRQASKWHRARNCLMPIAAWAIVSTQLVFAGTSSKEIQVDGVLFELAALEGYRFEKRFCEESYPEFKDKNETAFRASPYSKKTGEELITSMTTGDIRQKLLASLPEMRAGIRERYMNPKPQFLKNLCSSYAAAIEQQSTGNTTAQQKRP